MTSLVKTTALDPNLIAALLKQEQDRKEANTVKAAQADAFYRHAFDKKFLYLFALPDGMERMFVPQMATEELSDGKWQCIACPAIYIKNRESHFNWHKRELT